MNKLRAGVLGARLSDALCASRSRNAGRARARFRAVLNRSMMACGVRAGALLEQIGPPPPG